MFCANDSAPNLDYLRDIEVAAGALADGGPDVAVTKNPRQEVQHAHLHAFHAERGATENHESSALMGYPVIGAGHRAFGAALESDAVEVEADSTRFAAEVTAAARPWGGSYCSYQLGLDGPFWVMPAFGPSMDEFNRVRNPRPAIVSSVLGGKGLETLPLFGGGPLRCAEPAPRNGRLRDQAGLLEHRDAVVEALFLNDQTMLNLQDADRGEVHLQS